MRPCVVGLPGPRSAIAGWTRNGRATSRPEWLLRGKAGAEVPREPVELGHAACQEGVPHEDHDKLRLGLMRAGQQVLAAPTGTREFDEARERLVAFCEDELLPHLERDERWLTKTSECTEGRLLGLAMRAEARALRGGVDELVSATNGCEVMAATRVVHALLAAHVHHQELLGTVDPGMDMSGGSTTSAAGVRP